MLSRHVDDAVATTIGAALDGSGGYVCLCNVHVLETAQRDPRLMTALAGARIVFPDGSPIAWLQRLGDNRPAERQWPGPT